jgi:Rrf2 family protein
MKISTRTRYGLRFLVYLAIQDRQRYVQLNEVAKHESISLKYLEQIIRLLRPSGILHSQRGAKGGYSLVKKPESITLEQIFTYLEGDLHPVNCLIPNKPGCPSLEDCSTIEMWREFETHIRSFLRSYTLEDLARRKVALEDQKSYVI